MFASISNGLGAIQSAAVDSYNYVGETVDTLTTVPSDSSIGRMMEVTKPRSTLSKLTITPPYHDLQDIMLSPHPFLSRSFIKSWANLQVPWG